MAKITDYEDVVKSLFEFYFPDLEKEYLSHFNYNSWELGKKNRNSIYSASVKNGLYSIAVDPMQAIHKLSSELLRVQHYLAKEYERTEESRRILQSGFDYVKTLEILKENKICQGIDFEQYREIVVSFLFCNIQHIDVCCNGQTLFLFLGRDYVRRLEELSTTAAISALDTFGNAIAEKNRVAILDLIKENGDVSISEIKKILGLTEANIYYHLTLMLKAGLLKIRKQRKTIYYGLNKDYFELIIQKIQQYL